MLITPNTKHVSTIRIVFGDIDQPSASPQQKDRLLALSAEGACPPSGLRPPVLPAALAAIFLASSFTAFIGFHN